MSDDRTHLGDGAYATFDGYYVWVETETERIDDYGRPVMHRVALEPSGLVSLVMFATGRIPGLAGLRRSGPARPAQPWTP